MKAIETVCVLMARGGEPVEINLLDFDAETHHLVNLSDAARVALAKAGRAANDWRPAHDPQNASECAAADAEREAVRQLVRAEWLERLRAA